MITLAIIVVIAGVVTLLDAGATARTRLLIEFEERRWKEGYQLVRIETIHGHLKQVVVCWKERAQ